MAAIMCWMAVLCLRRKETRRQSANPQGRAGLAACWLLRGQKAKQEEGKARRLLRLLDSQERRLSKESQLHDPCWDAETWCEWGGGHAPHHQLAAPLARLTSHVQDPSALQQ